MTHREENIALRARLESIATLAAEMYIAATGRETLGAEPTPLADVLAVRLERDHLRGALAALQDKHWRAMSDACALYRTAAAEREAAP